MTKSCCEWKNSLSIASPILGLIFSDVDELVMLCKDTSRKYYRASLGLTITTLILTIFFGLIELITIKYGSKCGCKIDGRKTSSFLAALGLVIIMLNAANLTVDSIEKNTKN